MHDFELLFAVMLLAFSIMLPINSILTLRYCFSTQVYDVDGEVERHRLIRDSLELELQALRQRLSTVENFTDIVDTTVTNIGPAEDQVSRLNMLLNFCYNFFSFSVCFSL